MIDKTLCEKKLEAPFIIQGFVNDEPKCNYERYLTELINRSELFMRKSNGKPFHRVEHQAHGECDAVSDYYSIDFKLVDTRSSLQGLRETSERITKIRDGAYAFGVGRLPEGERFEYIRTVAALRQYSVEDLARIAKNPEERIESEISIILKTLRVKKNLLMFYPYILMFSEPHSFQEGCKSIAEAFNDDLNTIRLYREKEVPNCDTYLCAVYEEKLIIYEDVADCWRFEDSVEMSDSKTYMDLYYTFGNGGFNVLKKR